MGRVLIHGILYQETGIGQKLGKELERFDNLFPIKNKKKKQNPNKTKQQQKKRKITHKLYYPGEKQRSHAQVRWSDSSLTWARDPSETCHFRGI